MVKARYALVLLFLVLLTACLLKPQAPSEVFHGLKQLPATLFALANPQPGVKQTATILRKNTVGRVSVGVIDNGVDYLHPDLLQQIKFDSTDGRILGAGLDLLGDDAWPHPSLIDPSLFALVATSIENGKINGVNGDPLEWIKTAQSAFAEKALAALKAEKALAGTLFADMINADSFVAFSVPDMVEQLTERKAAIAAATKAGQLLDRTTMTSPELVELYSDTNLDMLLSPTAWIANSSTGYPYLDDLFWSLVGTETVIGILDTVYKDLAREFDIDRRVKNYEAFLTYLQGSKVTDRQGSLTSEWWQMRFRNRNRNSILSVLSDFCAVLPKDARAALADTPKEKRFALIRENLVRQLELTDQFVVQYADEYLDNEKIEAQEAHENSERLLRFFDTLVADRPYLAKYAHCSDDPEKVAVKDSGFDNYLNRQSHPYLHSGPELHGTHVSGIIARQSKKIDIVPVRVLTASTVYLKEKGDRLRKEFLDGFKAWLKLEAVDQAVLALATKRLGKSLATDELRALMVTFLDKQFKNMYLDFAFFDQIKQAIRYVGKQQVKIANLSLGTSFQKAVFNPAPGGFDANRDNFLNFLVYEFFKYSVAQVVLEHAAGTLFVIASGNDGAWIDGRSRSGLPCDLSSPAIAQIERERGLEPVPNNRLDNILCVGSIDRNDEISSFMNLPLTSVPFVLSYGEAILAPVAYGTCDGSSQEVLDLMGELDSVFFPYAATSDPDDLENTRRLLDYMVRMGWVSPKETAALTDLQLKRLVKRTSIILNKFTGSVPGDLSSAVVMSHCMRGKQPRARLSGTSMATPSVAGFIASRLVPEVNKRGLSQADLYTSEEFRPAKLIELIKQQSPVFGGSSIIKDVTKVTAIKEWKPKAGHKVIGVIELPTIFQQ